jgi:hypothetical protein
MRTGAANRISSGDNLNGKLFIFLKSFHNLGIVFYKVRRIPFSLKPEGAEKMVRPKGNFHLCLK